MLTRNMSTSQSNHQMRDRDKEVEQEYVSLNTREEKRDKMLTRNMSTSQSNHQMRERDKEVEQEYVSQSV